jgi:hypothetical protein
MDAFGGAIIVSLDWLMAIFPETVLPGLTLRKAFRKA